MPEFASELRKSGHSVTLINAPTKNAWLDLDLSDADMLMLFVPFRHEDERKGRLVERRNRHVAIVLGLMMDGLHGVVSVWHRLVAVIRRALGYTASREQRQDKQAEDKKARHVEAPDEVG